MKALIIIGAAITGFAAGASLIIQGDYANTITMACLSAVIILQAITD